MILYENSSRTVQVIRLATLQHRLLRRETLAAYLQIVHPDYGEMLDLLEAAALERFQHTHQESLLPQRLRLRLHPAAWQRSEKGGPLWPLMPDAIGSHGRQQAGLDLHLPYGPLLKTEAATYGTGPQRRALIHAVDEPSGRLHIPFRQGKGLDLSRGAPPYQKRDGDATPWIEIDYRVGYEAGLPPLIEAALLQDIKAAYHGRFTAEDGGPPRKTAPPKTPPRRRRRQL